MYDKSERSQDSPPPREDLLKNVPKPSLSVDTPPPVPTVATPPPVNPVQVKLKTTGESSEEEEGGEIRAPFNTRIIAAVIDVVVVFGIYLTVSMILPSVLSKLGWLLGMAYLVTRDSLPFLGGQSVGKKAMKIKAIKLDGSSLVGDWQTSLIRSGVLAIPLFGLIELFVLLSREDKPAHGIRLGDEWAKTKVIVVNEPAEKEQ